MADTIRQLLSQTSYVADGSQTVWNFSFSGGYIDKSHVKAKYLDANRVEHQIAVTSGMFLGQYQLSITPPVAVGSELVIYRDTPKSGPLVDFIDAASLTEASLDLSAKQGVFVAAESSDLLVTTIASTDQIQAKLVQAEAARAGAAAAESGAGIKASNSADSAAAALSYLQAYRASSYGALAADPSTDPLGNSPTTGDEYFNTTANLIKRWNGATWQGSDISTANLAAPEGASLVGSKSSNAGAYATTLDEIAKRTVSVLDYIPAQYRAGVMAKTSTYDAASSLEAAWAATPEGGELVIHGRLLLKQAAMLSDKAVNINCLGEIEVADGLFTALSFVGVPDLTQPGTALTSLTEGTLTLSYSTPPAIKSDEYYVAFTSTENLVTRVGAEHYTPYQKIETHTFNSNLFALADSILYTYSDLSLLTLNYKRKARRTCIKNLKIVASPTAAATFRSLVNISYRSGITFDNLDIDSSLANRLGIGLSLTYCNDLVFNTPKVKGYNHSGGDSYKVLNSGSANLVFNDYVSDTEADPVGSKVSRAYVARHGNQITFNRVVTGGLDDHYGSNYTFNDVKFTGGGFGFAGKNASFYRCRGNGYAMFLLRTDNPTAHGTLLMQDCEVTPTCVFIQATVSAAFDPLGRTTPWKCFDHIKLIRPTVLGGVQSRGGYQYFVTLNPADNLTNYIPQAGKTILIDGLDNQSTPASVGYAAVMLGSVAYDSLTVRNSKRLLTGTAYYGDVRWFPGVVIPEVSFSDCVGIIPYGIVGATNVLVKDSVLDGGGEGLSIRGDGAAVTLTIQGSRIAKPISVAAGTGAPNPKIRLLRNSFSTLTAATAAYVTEADGNVVDPGVSVAAAWRSKLWGYADPALGQVGTLSGTVAYDPPSLAAGASTSTTVTVTGAALGDFAQAAFVGNTQGVAMTAQVTAGNTVTVTLHNTGVSGIDLASGTLKARVIKT